jgi:hypothetical protein
MTTTYTAEIENGWELRISREHRGDSHVWKSSVVLNACGIEDLIKFSPEESTTTSVATTVFILFLHKSSNGVMGSVFDIKEMDWYTNKTIYPRAERESDIIKMEKMYKEEMYKARPKIKKSTFMKELEGLA